MPDTLTRYPTIAEPNPRTAYYRLYRNDGTGPVILGRYIGFRQAMSAWDDAAGGEANFEDDGLWIEQENGSVPQCGGSGEDDGR